jgi:hypothetical protein
MVVGIAVACVVTVTGTGVGIVVAGFSVSTMTYEPVCEDWFDGTGFSGTFPEFFRTLIPAAIIIMTIIIARAINRIFFPDCNVAGRRAIPAVSSPDPSGEPHWPQNLSTDFAGAPQEGQVRNTNHRICF